MRTGCDYTFKKNSVQADLWLYLERLRTQKVYKFEGAAPISGSDNKKVYLVFDEILTRNRLSAQNE